ncbi:MAG: nucleoside diphosphate kinase regulator [Kiritimatiellia bacterium]|nr:nucleoside diphosphate kinase regulator [Kiritimatiellia bacterium]
MTERTLYITELDRQKLEELVSVAGLSHDRDQGDLKSLENELRRARIVGPEQVPPDVVTLHSRVRLREAETKTVMELTLVMPAEADVDAGKLSVLSPVGTAILGYAEGDTIEWTVPAGRRRFVIEKLLFQPEAAGRSSRE